MAYIERPGLLLPHCGPEHVTPLHWASEKDLDSNEISREGRQTQGRKEITEAAASGERLEEEVPGGKPAR